MNKNEQEQMSKIKKENEALILKIAELEQAAADKGENESDIESFKAELDKVSEELVSAREEIAEIEKELEAAERDAKITKGARIILKTKDLIKGKKYITGPNGIGYVEA